MLDVVILAVALAMDATAVAAARAVAGAARRDLVVLALAFGAFQAGMAAIGLVAGTTAAAWVASWDHWLAFGLLVLIGGKMLVEAWRDDGDDAAAGPPRQDLRTVILLSVATSIDALAAGVTLPTLAAPPALALALIGAASFLLSLAGARLASALGAHLGRKLELAGGLALIAIGVKILVEHLG